MDSGIVKLSRENLHWGSIISGGEGILDSDHIFFDRIDLELLLERTLLAVMNRGADEISLKGLVIFQLLFESLGSGSADPRLHKIEYSVRT